MSSIDLVVVGQGYVGLPMALRAAEAGLVVVGLDSNVPLVNNLSAGRSHIGDISDSQLSMALKRGYSASSDPRCMAEANAVVVCVPTPLTRDGGPDLTAIRSAAVSINAQIEPGTVVALESTTYPGTTEEVFAPLVLGDRLRLGADVNIAFSPERIDPGNRQYGVQNTPKVVGGLTPDCTRRAHDLYSQFVDEVVCAAGAREAEMSKLLENTFRHVNIALVNEMVRFCDDLGIDLWDSIDCAGTKPFGFMPFRPGPGVGGHCIPVDPSYLSHRVRASLGYSFRMVELAEEINKAAPIYVANRVRELLNERSMPVKGSEVLLLGVTYKPDVADCRETPATPLGERLLSWGAKLSYHDPLVPNWSLAGRDEVHRMMSATNVYDAARKADLTVLLQPHAVYDLARLADSAALLFDTRGALKPAGHVVRL